MDYTLSDIAKWISGGGGSGGGGTTDPTDPSPGGGLAVTFTYPAALSNVPTSTPTLTWTVSPGTQIAYRLQIFQITTVIRHYDSGYIRSTSGSHLVPGGFLLDGENYIARVDVSNNSGLNGDAAVPFSIVLSATAPPIIPVFTPSSIKGSNIGAVAIAGTCYGMSQVLPRIRLAWNPPTISALATFVRYLVKRRVLGTTLWTRIAEVESFTTRLYDDYNVGSYTVYQYSIVAEYIQGDDTIVSPDMNPPLSGEVQFAHFWLHEVCDPSVRIRFDTHEPSQVVIQEQNYLRSWGRTAPTMFVGSQQSSEFSVPGLERMLRDPKAWNALTAMMTSQRESASILCARFGMARVKAFVQIRSMDRQMLTKQQQQNLDLVEVHYDEEISSCPRCDNSAFVSA